MFTSKRISRRVFGVLAALAIGATATGTAWAQETGVTKDQILIGTAFAMSGPVRFITKQYEQGIQTVFTQVNAAGGINGRKIKWLIEDDGYQAARTVAGVKKLIERDNVFMIFGVVGQGQTNAVVPLANELKIPMVGIVGSTEPSRYVAGLLANYPEHTYAVTKELVKMGAKRIGYLYQNDDLGAFGRAGVDRALKELNIELAATVGFERGTQDLTTSVLKLRDAGVDTAIVVAAGPVVGLAIKQAGAVGYKPRWGTFSAGIQSSVTEMLGDQINGLVFTSEAEVPYTTNPAVAKVFAEVLKAFPDAKPDSGTLHGYAHASWLVRVLTEAGPSLTREKFVQLMNATKSFNPGGVMPLSLTESKRTAADGIKVFQWQKGQPVPLTDWLPVK